MDPELLAHAALLRAKGWPLRLIVADLAEKGCQVALPTLHYRLKAAGYVYRGKRGPKPKPKDPKPPRDPEHDTFERNNLIRLLVSQGVPQVEMAKRWGISRQRVAQILRSPG